MPVTLAIGADHAGFALKQNLIPLIAEAGFEVHDFGTHEASSVDYPDFAREVGSAVAVGRYNFGILVCGTGIGMAIAANKVPGVRAAKCSTEFEAEMARRHNNANVLTLGGRIQTAEVASRIVQVFLAMPFDGGRHVRRLDMIAEMERPGGGDKG